MSCELAVDVGSGFMLAYGGGRELGEVQDVMADYFNSRLVTHRNGARQSIKSHLPIDSLCNLVASAVKAALDRH